MKSDFTHLANLEAARDDEYNSKHNRAHVSSTPVLNAGKLVWPKQLSLQLKLVLINAFHWDLKFI